MIKKYVKKPIPIEAIQFTEDNGVWIQENFCPKFNIAIEALRTSDDCVVHQTRYWIETLQGNMAVKIGDYVVKGIRGQFYSCDRDIFRESYDQI